MTTTKQAIPAHWKPKYKVGDHIENNSLYGEIIDIIVGGLSIAGPSMPSEAGLGVCYSVKVTHAKNPKSQAHSGKLFSEHHIDCMMDLPQEVYETLDLRLAPVDGPKNDGPVLSSLSETYVSPFSGRTV